MTSTIEAKHSAVEQVFQNELHNNQLLQAKRGGQTNGVIVYGPNRRRRCVRPNRRRRYNYVWPNRPLCVAKASLCVCVCVYGGVVNVDFTWNELQNF